MHFFLRNSTNANHLNYSTYYCTYVRDFNQTNHEFFRLFQFPKASYCQFHIFLLQYYSMLFWWVYLSISCVHTRITITSLRPMNHFILSLFCYFRLSSVAESWKYKHGQTCHNHPAMLRDKRFVSKITIESYWQKKTV